MSWSCSNCCWPCIHAKYVNTFHQHIVHPVVAVCVCVYTYIYIYIYTCIHPYIHFLLVLWIPDSPLMVCGRGLWGNTFLGEVSATFDGGSGRAGSQFGLWNLEKSTTYFWGAHLCFPMCPPFTNGLIVTWFFNPDVQWPLHSSVDWLRGWWSAHEVVSFYVCKPHWARVATTKKQGSLAFQQLLAYLDHCL